MIFSVIFCAALHVHVPMSVFAVVECIMSFTLCIACGGKMKGLCVMVMTASNRADNVTFITDSQI